MKKLTMLSNKSSTAWSCAENRIFVGFLRTKSSEQDFKYLYWRISNMLLWHIFTWKGIYMIAWVGRIICTHIFYSCVSIYSCVLYVRVYYRHAYLLFICIIIFICHISMYHIFICIVYSYVSLYSYVIFLCIIYSHASYIHMYQYIHMKYWYVS